MCYHVQEEIVLQILFKYPVFGVLKYEDEQLIGVQLVWKEALLMMNTETRKKIIDFAERICTKIIDKKVNSPCFMHEIETLRIK